ncbi:hypothetical protein CRUP_023891 [Coryphaenoides rupestris]|nr:hypothetical protein CRUP_023891 [Coryphaenoides rupestris]
MSHTRALRQRAAPGVLQRCSVLEAWTTASRELRQHQAADAVLGRVRGWLEEGRQPSWTEVSAAGPEVKAYHAQWGNLELHDGRSTEAMGQQVREHYEEMRAALREDERATAEALQQDLRRTTERLDQVTRGWERHLMQVGRAADAVQRALRRTGEAGDGQGDGDGGISDVVGLGPPEDQRFKKPDASEAKIRLNEGRFKRLLRGLRSVSKELGAQLPRKTLMLDSTPVTFDRQTCHPWLSVTADGRGLWLSPAATPGDDQHPARFDRVICALGAAPLPAGQCYWEVDVRCCGGGGGGGGGWAVGVAYGCLKRKGRDKGARLGRNRNSWCLEQQQQQHQRDGGLVAWHNDRGVTVSGGWGAGVGRVGVWLHHEKGLLRFYDAGNMALLQAFSSAVTTVFDRAHHQFTEPLYPAVCLLEPAVGGGVATAGTAPTAAAPLWASHVEICDLAATL